MANKMAKRNLQHLAVEESRYPYLDQTLIEFILSIPAIQVLRPGERRSLMRRALVDVVPHDILSRRTKQIGQRTPAVALENNFHQLKTIFNSPISSHLGYIDSAKLMESVCALRNGKDVHIGRLFRTISLEFWLRDLVSRGLCDADALKRVRVMPVSLQRYA